MTYRGAFFGEFRVYSSGRKLYLAARLPDEQVRVMGGAWALDVALDGWLKMLGAQYVGIAVSKRPSRNIGPKNVAEYYIMRVDEYYHYRRKEVWNYAGKLGAKRRGGSRQWLIDPMFMHKVNMLSEKERLAWTLRIPT